MQQKHSTQLLYFDFNIYIHEDVHRPVKAHISNGCLIGQNTTLADFIYVDHSVIGANCVIEERVQIVNSTLWSNVRVGAGSVIHSALLGQDVIIGTNCQILEGCVIHSHSVVLDGTICKETVESI